MLQSIKGTGVQVNVLQVDKRPRVLDLFCGTGSWDGPFRKLGWEVHTLDINPKFQPTICCDLLDWDFEKFKPGHFDVIVASPHVNCFLTPINTNRMVFILAIVWYCKLSGSSSIYDLRYGSLKIPEWEIWHAVHTCSTSPTQTLTTVNFVNGVTKSRHVFGEVHIC